MADLTLDEIFRTQGFLDNGPSAKGVEKKN